MSPSIVGGLRPLFNLRPYGGGIVRIAYILIMVVGPLAGTVLVLAPFMAAITHASSTLGGVQ